MKFCNLCGVEKPLDQFHKRLSRPLGVASNCKQCTSERERKRYAKKKEDILKRVRQYNDNNRERINARQRKYNTENKDKRRVYVDLNRGKINRTRREWLKKYPAAALAERYRRRLNRSLSLIGVRKTRSSLEFLGCTFEEFVGYIESRFKGGMSWDNRSEWEIDHIIPISSAKTEADVIRLSHYTNLQPLCGSENRRKSNKLL